MSATRIALLCVWLAALPALAQNLTVASTTTNLAAVAPPASRQEQIRSACVAGRRRICGRVLQVTKSGLVVDSGYTSLLQPPLDHSWVTRANVAPARPAVLLEGTEPDVIAVGLVFLTDIPRRPAVRKYDYVALIGYPAGTYEYTPVSGVKKTLRRFAAGLERAVALTMKAETH
jgi:hypothetical protein